MDMSELTCDPFRDKNDKVLLQIISKLSIGIRKSCTIASID